MVCNGWNKNRNNLLIKKDFKRLWFPVVSFGTCLCILYAMSRPAYLKVILNKSLCCVPITCPNRVSTEAVLIVSLGMTPREANMVSIAGGREPDSHMPAPEAPPPKRPFLIQRTSHSHDQPQRWWGSAVLPSSPRRTVGNSLHRA